MTFQAQAHTQKRSSHWVQTSPCILSEAKLRKKSKIICLAQVNMSIRTVLLSLQASKLVTLLEMLKSITTQLVLVHMIMHLRLVLQDRNIQWETKQFRYWEMTVQGPEPMNHFWIRLGQAHLQFRWKADCKIILLILSLVQAPTIKTSKLLDLIPQWFQYKEKEGVKWFLKYLALGSMTKIIKKIKPYRIEWGLAQKINHLKNWIVHGFQGLARMIKLHLLAKVVLVFLWKVK